MATARAGIDVHVGLLPGTPEPSMSRQFFLTSEEWDGGSEKGVQAMLDLIGQAQAHAAYYMFQPNRVNWVKTEWVWF